MFPKSLAYLLFCLLLIRLDGTASELKKYSYSQRLLGIDVFIHLYSNQENKAKLASDKAFKKIIELEKIFSDYDAESEVRQLNNYQVGKPLKVSSELMGVLTLSSELHIKSDKAFDPTVRPLSILWRQARHSARMPNPKWIEKALGRVGFDLIELNPERLEVTFTKPSVSLDCGAIAKGAILDAAHKILMDSGHEMTLIDAGGDMVIGKAPPEQIGWKIKIEGLVNSSFELENCSIATSGDRYQKLVINNRSYSHIIDPRTGSALVDSHQVTIVGPRAVLADGLASTLSLMDPKEALTFIVNFPSYDALLIKERDGIKIWNSPGFKIPKP